MKFFPAAILIILPLVILLSSLQLLAFDYSWYDQQFAKLGIYQNFSQKEVSIQVNNLLQYLKGKEKLLKDYYTDREQLHLTDVYNILTTIKIINLVLFLILFSQLIILYFKSGIKKIAKFIFWATIFSLAAYLMLIILLSFNFDQIFFLFHKIAFTNNYWLLDPNLDYLIILFPPSLFAELAFRIIKTSLFVNLFILMLASLILLKNKKI